MSQVACASATDSASVAHVSAGHPKLGARGWTGPAVIPGDPELHVAEVSCVDARFCVAVGSGVPDLTSPWDFAQYPVGTVPLASTFDGTGWTVPTRLSGRAEAQGAETLTCTSTTFCLSTDGHGTSYAFDGSHWSGVPMPGFTAPGDTPSLRETVACVRPAFCMATLHGGQVTAFRAGTWTAPKMIEDGFAAKVVGCLDPGRCAVGGAYGVLDSDGSRWRDSGLGAGYVFYSLSCTPRTGTCSATGQDAFGEGTWEWNGHRWSVTQEPPAPPPHPG